MKKTERLTVRLDAAVFLALQTAAEHQNRTVSSQALHYIKSGLARETAPAPTDPRAANEFGFAAERGPAYKLPPPKT